MNIQAKYAINRHLLANGDIILWRGNDLIDKVIQIADKAYFNHIGIVWKVGERFLTVDATGGRGVNIDFLSTRVRQEVDFSVLRAVSFTKDTAQSKIDWALSKALLLGNEGYGYDYLFILQILIKNITGKDFRDLSDKKAYICSKFVQYYTTLLCLKEYSRENLITPQDYIRKATDNITTIIDREYYV